MNMPEFIRNYAIYVASVIAFSLGMVIGHMRGRIAGIREQAYMAQQQSTREMWKEFANRFKREDQ
jgi:hypothetical protein